MKRLTLLFFALIIVQLFTFSASAKIKVACVGNSITQGYTNYPSSLGMLLGENYEVGNFGNWGHTMQEKGTDSYMSKQPFIDAQNFNPDIVTIKLGTNDSKKNFWNKDTFEISLRHMISIFQALPTHPRIILCRPIPAYSSVYDIQNTVIKNEIPAILNKVSQELGLSVVDLYSAIDTLKEHDTFYAWDKIHVNYKGARVLAKALYRGITGTTFTMKEGGVTVPVSVETPISGQKLDLGLINFGSLPSYFTIQVQAELKAATGSFDFYLDDAITPFASVNLVNQSVDSTRFNTIFAQKIKDQHQVSVVWNDQSTKLNKVVIKETFAPFVPITGKKYVIINKFNGLAIQSSGTSGLYLNTPDGKNTAQQFVFDPFAYGVFVTVNQSLSKALCTTASNANLQDTQEAQSSLRIPAVGNGVYLIGTDSIHRLGKYNAKSNTIVSSHMDASIQDWDKWLIIEADKVYLALPQTFTKSNTIYGFENKIVFKEILKGDLISVYNAEGKIVYSKLADQTSLTISAQKGLYLIQVKSGKVSKTTKVLVK